MTKVIRWILGIILILSTLTLVLYFFQPLRKGSYTTQYKLDKNWPNLPADIELGNPVGLAFDSNNNIIVFHRAGREWPLLSAMPSSKIDANTILVLDNETGSMIRAWGKDMFVMPHGIAVDHDNNIWVTDVGLHQIFKFDQNGKLLMQLGEPGIAGNDSSHFDKPTDVTIASNGDFYVSDGYGNSRIVKFSADGKYLLEWGKKGSKPGQFNIPHGIDLDKNGNVYVADRENNRIQVFNSVGKFLKELTDKTFANICSVNFDHSGKKLVATDDLSFLKLKHRGSDFILFDSSHQIISRAGRSGQYDGPVCWYHDAVIDDQGSVYVADILGNKLQKFSTIDNR